MSYRRSKSPDNFFFIFPKIGKIQTPSVSPIADNKPARRVTQIPKTSTSRSTPKVAGQSEGDCPMYDSLLTLLGIDLEEEATTKTRLGAELDPNG